MNLHGEGLNLITSGPLSGKYLYLRVIHPQYVTLRRCSSALGVSTITSSSVEIMLSDELDISVLISPSGTYNAFKNVACTHCNGIAYLY